MRLHFLGNWLTDGGEVVSLTPDHPLPSGIFLVRIPVRDLVGPRVIVRLEGLGPLKMSNEFIGNRNRYLLYSSIWTLVVTTTAVFGFKYPRFLVCICMENIMATARRYAVLQWHPKSTFQLPVYRSFTSLWDPSYIFRFTAAHYIPCVAKQQTTLRSVQEFNRGCGSSDIKFTANLRLANRVFFMSLFPVIGEGEKCSRLDKEETKSVECIPSLTSESSKLSVFPLHLIELISIN
jgi:hypothetical protein